MQGASTSLAEMDYLACEQRCLEALAIARRRGDWSNYARVLLPLQEARRQRRMIAVEGTIRLGTTDLGEPSAQWLDRFDAGCIVLTHPHDRATSRRLHETARRASRHVEILFCDNAASAKQWTLRTFDGPESEAVIPAPPGPVLDRWLEPQGAAMRDRTAADWFLEACERIGDAVLTGVPQPSGRSGLEALEQCLVAVTDHEILHQTLGRVAREMAVGGTASE